jgi:histidinol-phosphate phosphatase family protein
VQKGATRAVWHSGAVKHSRPVSAWGQHVPSLPCGMYGEAVLGYGVVVPFERPLAPRRPEALLCDRDGTLIVDVPYNADPALVRPVDGVAEALDRARAAGLRVGVVTNQSGVARGLITPEQLKQVNARLCELLGPFDVIVCCPHDDPVDGEQACGCRKPRPGLVTLAAQLLGVSTAACVLIGDTGADVAAANGAGAIGVLVPNDATMPLEVRGAAHVHGDFASAVDEVLRWRQVAA